jgi:membrane protein implicated in regulation of membrane protease activity
VRSEAESIVLVVWVVLALVIPVGAIYSALAAGDWALHLILMVVSELVLAGLGWLALRRARRW